MLDNEKREMIDNSHFSFLDFIPSQALAMARE